MSDNQSNAQPNTLDDVENKSEPNPEETTDQPKSRKKRSLIDVPSRGNVGPDGEEADEFN